MEMINQPDVYKAKNRERQMKFYNENKAQICLKKRQDRADLKAFLVEKDLAMVNAMVEKNNKSKTPPTFKELFIPPFVLNEKNIIEELTGLIDENNKKVSVMTHINNIKKIFKIQNCEDLSDCLEDADGFVEKINTHTIVIKDTEKTYAPNTKTGIIHSLLFLLDKFNMVLPPDIRKIYQEYSKLVKLEAYVDVDKKIESLDESVLSYPVYLKKVLDRFGLDSKEYLLLSLYGEACARDDFKLHIITTREESIVKDKNYLLIYPDQKNMVLLFNNYKTCANKEEVEIQLSVDLSDLIRSYIKNFKVSGILFDLKQGNAPCITKMNKSLGINGGVNYIRHSVISTFINGNETDPTKRLELANKSFHSPITQIRYIRNIVDDIKE